MGAADTTDLRYRTWRCNMNIRCAYCTIGIIRRDPRWLRGTYRPGSGQLLRHFR